MARLSLRADELVKAASRRFDEVIPSPAELKATATERFAGKRRGGVPVRKREKIFRRNSYLRSLAELVAPGVRKVRPRARLVRDALRAYARTDLTRDLENPELEFELKGALMRSILLTRLPLGRRTVENALRKSTG